MREKFSKIDVLSFEVNYTLLQNSFPFLKVLTC